MLKRKKLNNIRRKRQAERQAVLDAKAKKELEAKKRERQKYLQETRKERNEKFRKEYKEMIHMEPHISTPQSISGVGLKKKSVLE